MGFDTAGLAPPPRIAPRARGLLYLVAGLILGVVLDRMMTPPPRIYPAAIPRPDTVLTRENYARIKPGMTSWEVGDILGPGTIVRESGIVVHPDGGFEEFDRGVGRSFRRTGSPAPKGAQTRVECERRWDEGGRSIRVVFLNDHAESKGCDGLY